MSSTEVPWGVGLFLFWHAFSGLKRHIWIGRRPSIATPGPTRIIWPSCISCGFLFWLHHSNGALPQSLYIPIAWSGLLDVDTAWKWRCFSQLAFLAWNVVINSSLRNGASWQERPGAVTGPVFSELQELGLNLSTVITIWFDFSSIGYWTMDFTYTKQALYQQHTLNFIALADKQLSVLTSVSG